MKCSFCDSEWGASEERDELGHVFYCCGWCWAHVLGGGCWSGDIRPTIAAARKWLLGKAGVTRLA